MLNLVMKINWLVNIAWLGVCVTVVVSSGCSTGKNEISYVLKLTKLLMPNSSEPIRLPRRMLGDVYLKQGYIYGLDSLRLTDDSVLLICYNDSVGAIQPKFTLDNVTFVYDWVYGDDESWGKAKTSSQKVYIDIDIEQSIEAKKPVMLGLYITKLINTKFEIEVHGKKENTNINDITEQVSLVTRTFIAQDAGVALTMDISPKVTDYLFYNKLLID